MKREISLALGGGGLKGMSHIGVIKRITELGYTIKAVSGTSIGGLIGALFCAGYSADEIFTITDQFNQRSIFHYHNDGPGLFNLQSITQILLDKLGDITFKDLKIKFACPAVDIKTALEYTFLKTRVVDAVLATIAVPGFFPPKIIDDKEFIDGATLNPVPVDLARWLSPKTPVVAVSLSSPPEKNGYASVNPIINSMHIPTPIIEQFSKLKIARAFTIFSQSIDITSTYLTELRLAADAPDVIIRPEVSNFGVFDAVNPSEMVLKGIRAVDLQSEAIKEACYWMAFIKRMNQKTFTPARIL